MTEQISQRELRNDSGRIMRALDKGRSFLISRHGRPIGELRPLRRERLVEAGIVVDHFRGAPPIDRAALLVDLDTVVDQGAEPRA